MCSILYDNKLRSQLFKTKENNGFVFQKDLYLINLLKKKHEKRVASLLIKTNSINNINYANVKPINLPHINLTNLNQITNDNSLDSGYISNRHYSNRKTTMQKYQFTNEATQSIQKRTQSEKQNQKETQKQKQKERQALFKIKQHKMSSHNIHMQFIKLSNSPIVSPDKYSMILKNKEIQVLIEKNNKRRWEDDT